MSHLSKQRRIRKYGIEFKKAKEVRLHAWASSTEGDDVTFLSALFNCSRQDVVREGVKQLKENTIGVMTREKI